MITLRRFIRLLRGQHRAYLSLVGAWTLLRIGTLAVGLLLQRVFDVISGEGRAGLNPWSVIAAIGGIEAARQTIQFTAVISRLEPGIVFRTKALLRDQLLTARLRAPAGHADDGQVLTTMGNDVEEVSTFAAWSPANIARWLFAVAAIVILITVDVVLGSAVLLLLLLLAVVVRLLHGRYRTYRHAGVAATARVRGGLRDAVAGVAVIQAAHAEEHVRAHLFRLGQARRQAAVVEETYGSLQQNIVANVAPLGTGLVLLVAAQGLRDGTLTVGDIALFGYYLQMLTEALASLGMLVVRLQRLGISLDRMYRSSPDGLVGRRVDLAAEQPSGPPPGADPPPAGELRELTVRSLSYRAGEGGPQVTGVSFTVTPGSLTVVTGRVGAGKTTLLRALLGLVGPVEGEILWNGRAIPPDALAPPRCAYVPQVPRLFTGTLRDNILLGVSGTGADLARVVRLARLEADLETMPQGLGTSIGPGGLRLSGGQLQRVAIARALVRRPAIVVLDDGSSALDGRTEGELFDELRRDGATVVAVSHRRRLLESADRIVLLEQGAMTGSGSLAQLLAGSPVMRSLWAGHAEPRA
ncbi:ABC transporter ATP-binding protein [Actinoplanes teichomyceticus]|uniref:ABC transporter n=1 Tax=Actinoplanes teichomyceticus TaxID=1867 RepID=A0A1B1ESM4_ACTTI|nr:ABC transporter ATP-binding protein [Actinoplanes teichomyceticus]ANQ31704.1 ABC transporter [Actinoplanes teichomyceticus]TWG14697.1 ATP-binding cassette subfamily B protein [Actinoplanes teichomyceticus]GIF10100.1 HlyB/MsbA family ABC transporter [Actinoplanes teichomyceticus]